MSSDSNRSSVDDETRSLAVERQERAERPSAWLHIVFPRELAECVELVGDTTVGRKVHDSTAVAIAHPTVSRAHLRIEWDSGRHVHTVTDLGSHNGSWIDGAPLSADEAHPLDHGMVLRAGGTLCVFERASTPPRSEEEAVSIEAVPGESAAVRRLRAAVQRAAVGSSPVLVVGATGTGKELVARELHRLSGRKGPMVTANCAALSPQLIEAQLFGHVRGAFTGATEAAAGLFRAADSGTLFLDEIGELPLALQPKLLRAVQVAEVTPVGATSAVKITTRIVAATNRDLENAVAAGTFRRDLFARLALWDVTVPTLAERRPDILGWLERLHARVVADLPGERPPLRLDVTTAELLLLHPWPENLRGIDRLAHQLSPLAAAGSITPDKLPAWLNRAATTGDERAQDEAPSDTSADKPQIPTREELLAALEQLDWNVMATARHFHRDRKQVYRWMKRHGIELER